MGSEPRGLAQLDELRSKPTERLREALSSFEQQLGGRDALIELLATASPTTAEEAFLIRLAEPDNDKLSLARVLTDSGMTVSRFFTFLKEAKGAKAVMDAMGPVYAGLKDVTTDIVDRAIRKMVVCKQCKGAKVTYYKDADNQEKETTCGYCGGAGEVEVGGDLDRQKLVLDLAGLLKKSPIVQKNIDARSLSLRGGIHVGDVNHHHLDASHTQRFLQATDEILFGPARQPPVIDAEKIEEAVEGPGGEE